MIPGPGTRYLVVGTAGHIDHGKSSVVHALTGIDPDRLEEEKRRGITIDLGFADLDLGAGRILSFVDVPGHERFVRHMVAGATGIDAVLLVVAADDGVRPQTREHLEICTLLGVGCGVVALSKSDLVPHELLEVVKLEVAELLAGTFLESSDLVPVSSRTGEGLDDLRGSLGRLLERTPPRPSGGVARLPVDRSFVLRGFGSVVTGTLVSGELHEGQEVEVLPGGKRGRIRGLQVHGRPVGHSAAGQRTAVNLQGLDCADVPRGATITTPGALLTTRRAWGLISLLPGAPRGLDKGGPVRFHQGTCERAARLRILGREEDGRLRGELHLGDETVLAPGDRFILRRPAPVDTVGGGVLVDVRPPRLRESVSSTFRSGATGSDDGVKARLCRADVAGIDSARLRAELGLSTLQIQAALERLAALGQAVRAGPRWLDGELWRRVEGLLIESVESFHREQPLRAGVSREELRSQIAREMPQEVWRGLLEGLRAQGEIRLAGERVARAGHEVVLGPAERELARSLEARFREADLDPPELEQGVAPGEREVAGPIVELLVAEGKLVRIQDGRLFHAEALDRLRAKLREYGTRSRTIDVAAFKELAGVTRRNAIPLLEQLDAERMTRRVGNLREILG